MSIILRKCGNPRVKKVAQWFSRQIKGTFFNTILVTLDAFYVVMIFTSMMNIQNQDKAGG